MRNADDRVNLMAEVSVLGAMLLDMSAIPAVAAIIDADDFSRSAHQILFEALLEMEKAGVPPDMMTAYAWLDDKGKLGEIGGTEYIAYLLEAVPSAANAPHYAYIVAQESDRRKVLLALDVAKVAIERGEGIDIATRFPICQ